VHHKKNDLQGNNGLAAAAPVSRVMTPSLGPFLYLIGLKNWGPPGDNGSPLCSVASFRGEGWTDS